MLFTHKFVYGRLSCVHQGPAARRCTHRSFLIESELFKVCERGAFHQGLRYARRAASSWQRGAPSFLMRLATLNVIRRRKIKLPHGFCKKESLKRLGGTETIKAPICPPGPAAAITKETSRRAIAEGAPRAELGVLSASNAFAPSSCPTLLAIVNLTVPLLADHSRKSSARETSQKHPGASHFND